MSITDPTLDTPAARRREFIRSFLAQTWARPGADRPLARPHVVLMVTLACLAGAVLTGVVLQLVHPAPHPAAVGAPVALPTGRFTAVSGWDCAGGADRGFDAQGRTSAWYTVALGGWGADGCHGTFEAIPMTGQAGQDDPNQSATWWFTPGTAVTKCAIQVYLPATDHPADAAATAALYTVLSGRGGTSFAQFVVDQTARRGAWYDAGDFAVTPDGIAVRLGDRGAPASPDDRLAVTQVRVDCHN